MQRFHRRLSELQGCEQGVGPASPRQQRRKERALVKEVLVGIALKPARRLLPDIRDSKVF